MKIGPVDIRNHEFQKKGRGVDVAEVRDYLDLVADRLEEVILEGEDLKTRISQLEGEVQEFRSLERSLRDSLTSRSCRPMRSSICRSSVRSSNGTARHPLRDPIRVLRYVPFSAARLARLRADRPFCVKHFLDLRNSCAPRAARKQLTSAGAGASSGADARVRRACEAADTRPSR